MITSVGFHGPHWRYSWVLVYAESFTPEQAAFVVAEAIARLERAKHDNTLPLLSDIYISRLAATIQAAEAARFKFLKERG